jgi:hypothetical protein
MSVGLLVVEAAKDSGTRIGGVRWSKTATFSPCPATS